MMVANFFGRVARRMLDRRLANETDTKISPDDRAQVLAEAAALLQSGRFAEARARYLALLERSDADVDVCCMLGVLAHQEGDHESAIAWIRRALEIDPGHVLSHNNLGLIQRSLGRLGDAEGELRKAVELAPEFDGAHANLGLVLLDRGDANGAEAALLHAVRLNPRNVEALNNLGNVCRDAGRLDEAESHYRQALSNRPESASLWENLAAVAVARGDWEMAASSYRSAIAVAPRAATAWSSLGFVLGQSGHADEAEQACRQALELRPDWPDGMVNLATVLDVRDPVGSEAIYRAALALDATHVGAWIGLGSLRKARLDLDEAEPCFRRAIALDARSPMARYNLGVVRLLRGDYVDGFTLLESRIDAFPAWYSPALRASLASDTRWRGGSLAGKRVLVWCEQGFGDNLMMFRYLPMLKGLGASHVTVVCDRSLLRIVHELPGVDHGVAIDDAGSVPKFDVCCPTMSLPHYFGTTIDTVPFDGPYVVLQPKHAADISVWSERLPTGGSLRVGVVWAGNPGLRDDAKRTIPVAAFASLWTVHGVQWISLQKGDAVAQIGQWGVPIIDLMSECRDFFDTASLIANLDLVISVDTAVVHLAGAMGKPVWLLNRAGSEWRWGLSGERSQWYPSLRMFRQVAGADWQPTMHAMAAELEVLSRLRAPATEIDSNSREAKS